MPTGASNWPPRPLAPQVARGRPSPSNTWTRPRKSATYTRPSPSTASAPGWWLQGAGELHAGGQWRSAQNRMNWPSPVPRAAPRGQGAAVQVERADAVVPVLQRVQATRRTEGQRADEAQPVGGPVDRPQRLQPARLGHRHARRRPGGGPETAAAAANAVDAPIPADDASVVTSTPTASQSVMRRRYGCRCGALDVGPCVWLPSPGHPNTPAPLRGRGSAAPPSMGPRPAGRMGAPTHLLPARGDGWDYEGGAGTGDARTRGKLGGPSGRWPGLVQPRGAWGSTSPERRP